MWRSRRQLSNEYLLAKIGVDTAENEPRSLGENYSILFIRFLSGEPAGSLEVGTLVGLGRSSALEGSFSAVSKPIFATKY